MPEAQRRRPVLAIIIVAIAVAAMIGLGTWQLSRANEKAALLKNYASAGKLPEMAFPANGFDRSALFRRASGFCLQPMLPPRTEAGRNARGESGWRFIVACRTGAEGPGMLVDIGWSKDFKTKVAWSGGAVAGVIGQEPDKRSMIDRTFGRGSPPMLLLVATTPAGGLQPSAPPTLDEVPNNHLAYAVQWFLFAAVAALIFGLVLYRRSRA